MIFESPPESPDSPPDSGVESENESDYSEEGPTEETVQIIPSHHCMTCFHCDYQDEDDNEPCECCKERALLIANIALTNEMCFICFK